MQLMPDLLANNRLELEDLQDLADAMTRFSRATDSLSANMVTNGQLMEKIAIASEFYEKYGG